MEITFWQVIQAIRADIVFILIKRFSAGSTGYRKEERNEIIPDAKTSFRRYFSVFCKLVHKFDKDVLTSNCQLIGDHW